MRWLLVRVKVRGGVRVGVRVRVRVEVEVSDKALLVRAKVEGCG